MSAASIFQLLPVSLALLPLAIAPGLLFYFDITPKIFVLLMVTAIGLLFVKRNIRALRALQTGREGRWLIYLLAAQAVSVIVSTACSGNLALAITGGAWRRSGAIVELGVSIFALLLAAHVAAERNTLQLILRSVTVSCLFASLYAIAQFFGIDPLLPANSYHAGEGIWTIVRPPSTMGNANFLANYLIYATFCSAALLSSRDTAPWKWIAGVSFFCGAVAIVLSGSRAGLLGLAAGTAVLLIGASARLRWAVIVSGVCAIALFSILAVSPMGLPLKARVRWSREDALGGGRLLLWRDSARAISSRWLTGFGPDNFGREFPKFQSVDLAQVHPDFYQESPHNALLDAAAAEGVPGFILSLAILSLGFFAAWTARRSEPRLALCLAAGLVGGTASGQFSSPDVVTRVYQLAAIAILCAIGSRLQPESTKPPLLARPLSWTAAATLLLFGITLAASDILAGSFQHSAQMNEIDNSVHRYRVESRYSLPGFQIDLYASRTLAQLSLKNAPMLTRALAWQEALRAGELATQTAEDRQNAFFNLAQLYAQQNDAVRTEQNLRFAIQAAPNWFKPHWILAELLKRTGRTPEACEEIRVAMRDDAGKDSEVVRTWRELGSPR